MIGIPLRILLLLVSYLIVRITKSKLFKKLNQLMMAESEKAAAVSTEEEVVVEKPPSAALVIREMDANIELSEAKTIREETVAQALKEFNRLFLIDLGLLAVYALIPMIDSFFHLAMIDTEMYSFYVGVVFFWTLMRFIGHRRQFKAYRKGIFGFLGPVQRIIFFPFQTLWYQALFFFLLFIGLTRSFWSFTIGDALSGFLFLIPIGLHLFALRQVRLKGRKKNNIKLLILRVFFLDKSSEFTFSYLAKYWKHFGSYFTVADPSFYRVFWKRRFNNTFPIFIIVVFLVFTQLTDDQPEGTVIGMFVFFVVLLLLGSVFYVNRSTRKMSNSFVHSAEQLEGRLDELDKWPVKNDNTFKEFPVMCYDNTWKIGLSTLVDEASVIMMDLRGFSEKNKGCEYEIDFILDHKALKHILFVCKPEARELVKRTIMERWEKLSEKSPNIEDQSPEATLFISEEEDAKELQHIMDLLKKGAMA